MKQQGTLDASKLQEGFNNFYSGRQEGDIDLVALVHEALRYSHVSEESLLAYSKHPLIIEASNKQPSVQRWLLNRYWVLQLVSIPVNSVNIRLYLIQNGTEEDWMRLFTQHVLPFLISNGLPKVL